MTLVPGFAASKETELRARIGKINRLPGMSIQEGLSFNTNKTNPFIPDMNGSGFAPFMFAGGSYPNAIAAPSSPGDEQTDPNNNPNGPSAPGTGGGNPSGPPGRPNPPIGGSDPSGSDSSSSSSSGSTFSEASDSSGSGSGSDVVVVDVYDGGVAGESPTVVIDALVEDPVRIIDGGKVFI
jgi:hypothetical protein